MPLQPGIVLNQRYRIVRLLGQGGFGAVYRAWDLRLSMPVALKENLEVSQESQKQFEREARILANLNHPNLPRVTDHFMIEGQGQYLVMDFVEGDDLDKKLEQGALTESLAVEWISQVCEALAYLHSQNPPIIHRDIKPANIKITPGGVAKLVDFGIAKVYDPHLKTTLGARAVTPGFSPAEQYGQGSTDARTDLYALGATLYTLLTGEAPVESIQRMVNDPVKPPDQTVAGVKSWVSQAVMRALQMDPAKRFQSAAEFKAALAEPATPLVAVQAPAAVSFPATEVMPAPSGPLAPGGVSTPLPPVARESHPIPAKAATQTRALPWKWLAILGGGLLAVVCLAVGFIFLSRVGGGDGESPTRTPLPVAVGPADTQAAPEPTGENEPPPTAQPLPTEAPASPTPAFRSDDPQTLTISGWTDPDTLDPAYNYESSGQAILLNIYDTLVFYAKDDPGSFIPQLAEEVPTLGNGGISADGLRYTFQIRQGVKFQDGSLLTPEDVAFTFQRNLLQGGYNSPQFLFTEPLLGIGRYDVGELVGDGSAAGDAAALGRMSASELSRVCELVKSKIIPDNNRGTVTFELEQSWAPFLATLAQPWGSIQSKNWVSSHGGWDGNCSTWQKYYGKESDALIALGIGSKAMGTGPYALDHWTSGKEIVLKANEAYWRSEPAWPGAPVGAPAIKTVVLKTVSEFDTSYAMLEAGDADTGIFDSTHWPALDQLTGQVCNLTDQDCQPSSQPEQRLEMVRGFSISTLYGFFLNWDIITDGGNSYIGSGKLDGNGIPAGFFSNIHVRKAFAYCFDAQAFFEQVYESEAEQRTSFLLPGMPGYQDQDPKFPYNISACASELKQASFDGKSVWDTGFRFISVYNSGNTVRKVFSEVLQKGLAAASGKFVVEVREIEWSDYLTDYRNRKVPVFFGGWINDIHDPHNLVVPFATGTYAIRQGLPENLRTQFDNLIAKGVKESDSSKRAGIYQQLSQLYADQAPVILLFQPSGRYYQQRWVQGRFSNPILAGIYFYTLYKD